MKTQGPTNNYPRHASKGSWTPTICAVLGFVLILLAIHQFFAHEEKNVDQVLVEYTKRRPTTVEIEKRALPKARPPSFPGEAVEVKVPESPTGDPELDVVYFRNQEWRNRYDEYKALFMIAQETKRAPPTPPLAPWVVDEMVKNSNRNGPTFSDMAQGLPLRPQ